MRSSLLEKRTSNLLPVLRSGAAPHLPAAAPPPLCASRSKEWVIDARTKGNTLRFANHSEMANCKAQ